MPSVPRPQLFRWLTLFGECYTRHSSQGNSEMITGIHCGLLVSNRWIFKATVFKTPSSKGLVGYGECRPNEYFSDGPRSRNANCRYEGGNRALTESLWNRTVLRCGTRLHPSCHPLCKNQPSRWSRNSGAGQITSYAGLSLSVCLVAHLALAALLAICLRCSGVNLLRRAFPPFRPRATAFASLSLSFFFAMSWSSTLSRPHGESKERLDNA